MVIYNCLRCGYSSKYKNNMKTHVFRKKICSPTLKNISSDELKEKFIQIPCRIYKNICK